ncbi:MAG: hypothetical protein KF773_11305 [Deltaproteobacteria bacterium]|nr:hypothetical protein [Deltaproteobacteria bacterium]
MNTALSLVAVCALATLHVLAPRLHGDALERPTWLSVAGGMSVAYVLVYLLPELAESQHAWLEAWPDRPFRWLDRQVYVTAMFGIILALGITYAAEGRRPGMRFWPNTVMFALHNGIVGAVGLRVDGVLPLALALLAFGAHFLVNDHALQTQHPRAFARYGRWVLAGSLVFGWTLSEMLGHPHVILVAALLGFLSGSIILNSIKEELPGKQQGRFPLFVVGALLYTTILLALAYFSHP